MNSNLLNIARISTGTSDFENKKSALIIIKTYIRYSATRGASNDTVLGINTIPIDHTTCL